MSVNFLRDLIRVESAVTTDRHFVMNRFSSSVQRKISHQKGLLENDQFLMKLDVQELIADYHAKMAAESSTDLGIDPVTSMSHLVDELISRER
jgi:hypothetical protein